MSEPSPENTEPLRSPLPDPGGKTSIPSEPLQNSEGDSTYNFVADKVGFVPNVRKSDNILQAKVFLAVWAVCILIGVVWGKGDGAFMGFLLGMVIALVVSGGVLTVIGLKRKS